MKFSFRRTTQFKKDVKLLAPSGKELGRAGSKLLATYMARAKGRGSGRIWLDKATEELL